MKKFLFITDAISSLVEYKDTSVLMMQTAFENNISIYVCEIKDLFYSDNVVSTVCSKVNDPFNSITDMEETVTLQLMDFDKVFMRKDPPVDENYMNALYLLEVAAFMGANIINEPKALQTFNEKVLALRFAKFMTETLITNQALTLKEFHAKHHEIILKPLNGMGGQSVYKFHEITSNELEVFDGLTQNNRQVMLQKFIPEIIEGDYRILIINGQPFHKALARIPQDGSFLGNLAAGGKGECRSLTEHQKSMSEEIGTFLAKNKIFFAGIDVIGSYLTEINITSPTGAREIFEQSGENPIQLLFNED